VITGFKRYVHYEEGAARRGSLGSGAIGIPTAFGYEEDQASEWNTCNNAKDRSTVLTTTEHGSRFKALTLF
jgi:hypothetical protein